MVDDAPLSLGTSTEEYLCEHCGERVRLALDGAGEGIAAEGAEAHFLDGRLIAGLKGHARIVHHDERAVALNHGARGGQVQGYDGDVFQPDVLPDIQLGPVRERKHPKALTGSLTRVVELPELGALLSRV